MINRVDYYTSIPSSYSSPSLFRGAPTSSRSGGATAAESKNSGGRKGDHTNIHEVSTVPGRARRARTAFSIAGSLVLVDGPLPFGDAAAAAILIGYGTYETVKTVQILMG